MTRKWAMPKNSYTFELPLSYTYIQLSLPKKELYLLADICWLLLALPLRHSLFNFYKFLMPFRLSPFVDSHFPILQALFHRCCSVNFCKSNAFAVVCCYSFVADLLICQDDVEDDAKCHSTRAARQEMRDAGVLKSEHFEIYIRLY